MKNTIKNIAIITIIGLTMTSCEFLDSLFGKKDSATEQVEEDVSRGYYLEYTYTIVGLRCCDIGSIDGVITCGYEAPKYEWHKREIYVDNGEVKSEKIKTWRELRLDYYGTPTWDTNNYITQLDIVALFSDNYEYVEGEFHYLHLKEDCEL